MTILSVILFLWEATIVEKIQHIQDFHNIPEDQRCKDEGARFWCREYWFAQHGLEERKRENTLQGFMSRETLVSKGQQNPMLPGVVLAPGAKEKRAFDSAKKKASAQYSKLSKMLAECHLRLLKHPKERTAIVREQFAKLEEWIVLATCKIEGEDCIWGVQGRVSFWFLSI